jgi:catechol 2,3-dioxygenase-like lactoylglutathione lyase family enzyme
MRRFWLSLWLALAAAARGQSPDAVRQPGLTSARGAFFALSVSDIGASERWYTEKLGLTVFMRVPKTGQSTVVGLAGGGLIVELIQLDSATPAKKDAELTHGIFKVGFIVDSLDKTVALLKARHVDIVLGPFPARQNAIANVIIRDNAGNLIQLYGL